MSELALPRRYFWRRSFATLIDVSLASLLSALILFPFLGNPDRIRLDGSGFFREKCVSITNAPQEAWDIIAPETPAAGFACKQIVFGIDNGTTLTLIYGVTKTAHGSTQRNVSFPVDEMGKPATPLMPQSLLMAALLIGMGGWQLRRGRQSPGKTLLGLRVEHAQAHPFRREALKYLFLIINGIVANLTWIGGTSWLQSMAGWSFATILAVAVLVFMVISAYYFLPMIRWRGAMPWDKLSGSFVQRKI